MEHQKILNLLSETNDSKFVTRKWNIVNDKPKSNYEVTNEITYNTEIWKSNVRDYNHAYILRRSHITVVTAPVTQVAFKNCAPFTKYITNEALDDAKDLDLVMPMYILLEYSLWLYS